MRSDTLWWSQGWLHLSSSCALSGDDAREVPRSSARGARCLCLVAQDSALVGEPRHRVRSQVSSALGSALAQSAVTPWQVVEAALSGMAGNDPLVTRARNLVRGAVDTEAWARRTVVEAIMPGSSPKLLWKAADALSTARRAASLGSSSAPKDRDLERWCKEWVKDGDTSRARTAFLDGPSSWSPGEEGHDPTVTRASWLVVADLLEAGAAQMLDMLNGEPERVVLVHDWKTLATSEGDELVWELLATHEYVLLGTDMGLKLPAHVADWLTNKHHSGPSYQRTRRSLDLGAAGSHWKGSLDTMMVLWRDAGGSFRYEVDAYGAERVRDGNAQAETAYRAARALEE